MAALCHAQNVKMSLSLHYSLIEFRPNTLHIWLNVNVNQIWTFLNVMMNILFTLSYPLFVLMCMGDVRDRLGDWIYQPMNRLDFSILITIFWI